MSTASTAATTQRAAAPVAPSTPTGPLGRVIAASLAMGLVMAGVLTFVVLPDASEATLAGGPLVAFAAGWFLIGWLTIRMTTRPQRWAYLPAAVMAAFGATLLVLRPGEPAATQLAWGWAPALVVMAAWVTRQTRRSVPGRQRLLVYPIALSMLLMGLGGVYQASTPAPEVAAGPMPGRLIDVGGYRLHLSCTGTGSPTVVLLNGLGETSPLWARIAPGVAAGSRVCVYDRAGQGWSDDSTRPADAVSAATDLHRLLAAAGESGPYVLAGHSSGGVHALTFAARYRHDVAGVVLLDSASPHQMDLVKPFTGQYELMRRGLAVAPMLFRLGIGHLAEGLTTPDLPGAAGEQVATFANSPRGMRSMRAEQAALPDAFRQAQALTTLGAIPLVVLTAQDNVTQMEGWGAAQDQLAALSTTVRHTVADLDHVALLEDASGAALSTTAITDVVTAVRTHTPLPTR